MLQKHKKIVRCICFLLCVAVAVLPLLKWFGYPGTNDSSRTDKDRYARFYREAEDTIEGVLVGTSSVHRAWAAPVAFEEEGITFYPLSTSDQPLSLAVSVLKEAKSRQNISYAVVDLRGIRMRLLGKSEESLRHCLDNIPMGLSRTRAVAQALAYNREYNDLVAGDEKVKLDAPSLYFPFLKYHTRWSEGLTEEDFKCTSLYMKGVADDSLGFEIKQMTPFGKYEGETELNQLQTEILDDIVAYGEEAGISIMFINSPAILSNDDALEVDAAERYLIDKGCDVFDMRTEECIEAMGLDYTIDWADNIHLNLMGAVKFTRYLGRYLKAYYDIPDMRGQEGYESWDEATDNFWTFYEKGWTNEENT